MKNATNARITIKGRRIDFTQKGEVNFVLIREISGQRNPLVDLR